MEKVDIVGGSQNPREDRNTKRFSELPQRRLAVGAETDALLYSIEDDDGRMGLG